MDNKTLQTYASELYEVMGAYSDCWMGNERNAEWTRNLNFRASGIVPRSVAMKILEIATPTYNEFDYKSLLKFDENCWFVIAREGSVCLYATRNNSSVDMPSAEEVGADEMALDEAGDNSLNTFRYWWD